LTFGKSMVVAELIQPIQPIEDITAPIREMSVIQNSLKRLESYDALEKNYLAKSLSASADCDKTHILAIVDRAREFTEKRQFYYLNNAVDYAIKEIERFHNNHSKEGFFLPNDVYTTLRKFLKIHRESLIKLNDGLKALKSIDKYNAHSSKAELKRWAENLESLGDVFEDNILFFDIETLEHKIQPLLSFAIQQSRQKNSNLDSTDTGKKDSYRIRIRNAAGFISRLIDAAIDDSDAEEEEIFKTISEANHPVFFEN
jgi:hypothetical protein